MHTCHSPAMTRSGIWRRATAVSSVGLPAGTPSALAQSHRQAWRTPGALLPPTGQMGNRRTPDLLPLHVAGDVATDVAPDVAAYFAGTRRNHTDRRSATYAAWLRNAPAPTPHRIRMASALLTGCIPQAMRRPCVMFPVVVRRYFAVLSGGVALSLRSLSGNKPGVSSIHLRMISGRLPHMKRNVAGISAAESAVSHRMADALSTGTTTAMQAVIL